MPSGQQSRDLSWFSVPVGAAVASGTLLWAPLNGESATMLAIALFAITLWIANPVPPAFTGLVVIGLVGITFSPELAFVGFRSAAMWLVVFGLLLGEAARASGLTHWGSRWIITRAWPGGAPGDSITAVRAYRRLLLALGLGGLALSFVIPSALVRVLTIAPLVTEIGDVFESDRARLGVFLGPTLVTFYAAPGVFTAGLPNITATGIADSLGAPTMSWSAWTLRMFPIMGLGRALVVTAVIYVLYRPPEETTVKGPSGEADQIGTERRMLLFLFSGVLFWMTDAIHGFHPVFGALLVVLLALLPRAGVVSFEELAGVDLSIVFFLGGVFAIGSGLTETGFTETVARWLLDLLPAGVPLPVLLAFVFGVTIAMTFLLEGLAVASVLTPVLVSYALAVGVPIDPVLMIEAVALGTYFFPYQSAVLVAILGEGISAGQLIRAVVWTSILTTVLLLPLQLGVFALLY